MKYNPTKNKEKLAYIEKLRLDLMKPIHFSLQDKLGNNLKQQLTVKSQHQEFPNFSFKFNLKLKNRPILGAKLIHPDLKEDNIIGNLDSIPTKSDGTSIANIIFRDKPSFHPINIAVLLKDGKIIKFSPVTPKTSTTIVYHNEDGYTLTISPQLENMFAPVKVRKPSKHLQIILVGKNKHVIKALSVFQNKPCMNIQAIYVKGMFSRIKKIKIYPILALNENKIKSADIVIDFLGLGLLKKIQKDLFLKRRSGKPLVLSFDNIMLDGFDNLFQQFAENENNLMGDK